VTRPRIVYIHGAGPQEHRAILKRRLDELLFGSNQLDDSIMAYYADILNIEPAIPEFLEGIEGAGVPEPDPPEARALDAAFTQRALVAAAADAQAAGVGEAGEDGLEGVNLFDPVFTIVASIASTDVIDYLFHDAGEQIRERVSAAIPGNEPIVVLAHSLGTIVAYDVLASRDDLDVRLLLTLGSPLGVGNVQRRIGDRSGPPARVPDHVAVWQNRCDPLDPVALEPTLADEFLPAGFVQDGLVDNEVGLANHDLTGYVSTPEVRALIAGAMAG
jgi:hypothetical protein